jgi:hypothetical protein
VDEDRAGEACEPSWRAGGFDCGVESAYGLFAGNAGAGFAAEGAFDRRDSEFHGSVKVKTKKFAHALMIFTFEKGDS